MPKLLLVFVYMISSTEWAFFGSRVLAAWEITFGATVWLIYLHELAISIALLASNNPILIIAPARIGRSYPTYHIQHLTPPKESTGRLTITYDPPLAGLD
jgi:hypothetical protein